MSCSAPDYAPVKYAAENHVTVIQGRRSGIVLLGIELWGVALLGVVLLGAGGIGRIPPETGLGTLATLTYDDVYNSDLRPEWLRVFPQL